MPENESSRKLIISLALIALVLGATLVLSLMGILPITFQKVDTVGGLEKFMNSPRDDMRALSVNGHMLELGKRPALQILKDYDEHFYQMRPYRKVNVSARKLTRYEVWDYCNNVTGSEIDQLRVAVDAGKVQNPLWQDGKLQIYRVSLFNYLVTGLSEHTLYMPQVELAQRMGMSDQDILRLVVPAQKRWHQVYVSQLQPDQVLPVVFKPMLRDELINWLNGRGGKNG